MSDANQSLRRIRQSLLTAFLLAGIALLGCGRGAERPNTANQIGKRRGWNVVLAEPCLDTLPVPPGDVIPAVVSTFKADNWRVQGEDHRRGDFVTEWKPIRHPLVSLFAGKIEARCAVSLRPLGSGRTLVVFQGGIASRKSIAHNPALGFAKRAYRKASQDWQDKLRAEVLRRHPSNDRKP